MKQFAVFVMEYHGGWSDFKGSFESLEEAIKYAKQSGSYPDGFWQVADLQTGYIVIEN